MNKIIDAIDLSKQYPLPKGTLTVFDGLNFSLERSALVAIMGVSGVGKTTLLNLLGLLDRPTRGEILLENEDVSRKNEIELAELRNRKVGFIFQSYHLLPEFSALENVGLPLMLRRQRRKDALKQAAKILDEVSLTERAMLKPGQLSGGEQQRVAIARALVSEPKLLLADEPTGNLDWKTGRRILELIKNLHQKKGLSSIIVTHNEKVAAFCQQTYLMEAGELRAVSPA